MSIIPFILELADELHEIDRCLATGGMDVDDFGFGIYPQELQPHQQPQPQLQHPLLQHQAHQQRRPRSLSQFYWLSNLSKSRHHPYYRSKTCCNKTTIHLLHDHQVEKEPAQNVGSAGGGSHIVSSPISVASAGDKELNSHVTNSSSSNTPPGKSAYSVVNKNGFQVSMNVKQFAPNELTVKTIDNCIVVEGQHEDKEDGHGVISRHFIRKYVLPKGYDPNEVLSTLSSDGILTVKAPPPPMKTDESMERIVNIQQTTVNKSNNTKDDQFKAAASAVEQPATVDTGTLPVTVTLSQQQKSKFQQLTSTVESAQQQQQPTKQSQPTAEKDLQITHERNGNLAMNESTAELASEPQTAEQTDMSFNTKSSNSNNKNSSVLNDDATTSSYENGEKESSSVEDAEKKIDEMEKTPQKSDAEATSSSDAIMATDTLTEPMETEEDEIVNEKEETDKTLSADTVPATNIEDEAMANVKNTNSVASSMSKTIKNIATKIDSLKEVETNGVEATKSNDDVDIGEVVSTAVAEANDITTVTKNGVASEPETKISADVESASLDSEIKEMDTQVTDAAANATNGEGVDGDAINGEGVDGDGITVGVDKESRVDVSASGGGDNGASVEDDNDENDSENILVVAAEAPSAGDLVAAADAAILLTKTQCDVDVVGAGDTASKLAMTTEEMAN
ncbi:heat shock protein 67B1-like [Eurosta solidaginis]|uniref:heat shock protein 67B1-like n=1 Tax=Eurosta solidaginis TaxID=178769 RepID=UPI003530F9B3